MTENEFDPIPRDMRRLPDPTLSLLFMIMRKADLLAISDGTEGKFAIAFAARTGDVATYIQGDDLGDLLTKVWDTVNR